MTKDGRQGVYRRHLGGWMGGILSPSPRASDPRESPALRGGVTVRPGEYSRTPYHVICVLTAFAFLVTVAPSLRAEFDEYDFSTPHNVRDLVFNFFHHCCGGNLLNDGLRTALQNIGYTVHSRISDQYVYENNHTDYRHWYKRFQRELGVKIGDKYYRYDGPGVTPTQEIPANSFMLTWYEFRAERMDIIMSNPAIRVRPSRTTIRFTMRGVASPQGRRTPTTASTTSCTLTPVTPWTMVTETLIGVMATGRGPIPLWLS